jgi:hypothetical protein
VRQLRGRLSRQTSLPGADARLALLPLLIENVVAAGLVAAGAFPAGASGATAGAVWPADVFFDLKESLAFGRSWSCVIAALALSSLVRGGVLGTSLWLLAGRKRPLASLWWRCSLLSAAAWIALTPAAVLLISGTAIRYAPFVVAGAAIGTPIAFLLARHAFRLAAGGDPLAGPTLSGWIAYAYLIAGTGALREWGAANWSTFGVAAMIAAFGLVHALVFLRWGSADPGRVRHRYVLAVTLLAVVAFVTVVTYHRLRPEASPSEVARGSSRLYLLGGVDSTTDTGALSSLDVRALGWKRSRSVVLSYTGPGRRYTAADTHRDLDEVARAVAAQVRGARDGDALVGHSQAALIIDRAIARGAALPSRVAVISPPPPFPPTLDLPPAGTSSPGSPAADLDRALVGLLGRLGLPTYDTDVPASPVNLRPVVARDPAVSRLAVWALGDSVWLDGDWRRPGEVNVVSLTDHVGAVGDPRTLVAARDFLAGEEESDDDGSWRGLLVSAIRYTFEPWRP